MEADFLSSSLIMFPVLKTAFELCAVAAVASGLTRSSLAPRTLSPPLPLSASTPALLASVLNLMLMQSERPLALLRHPYSAPSASGLQSTAVAFHLLSFRLRAPLPSPPVASFFHSLPQLCRCSWDVGLRAAADVVWRVVRSEIQCIMMLSENIMIETSQSRDITVGSLFILPCVA